MPRKARNPKLLTAYHIMVQGLNKEKIFDNDKDKMKYLYILKEKLDEYKVKLISYCIMNNHAHLLIYNEDFYGISKLMHKVNAIFSMYYNLKNNRIGFVFRDRFLSQEIYSYDQLIVCIQYIHNNPVKAKIVKTPDKYAFSSYIDLKYEKSKFIDIDLIRFLFDKKCFVDIWKFNNCNDFKLVEPNIYDRELFYSEIVNKINPKRVMDDDATIKRFLICCKEKYFVPNNEIAEALNVNKSTITRWIKKFGLEKLGE